MLGRVCGAFNLKLFDLRAEIVSRLSDTAVLQFILGCKEVHYFLRFMRNAEYVVDIDEYVFPICVPVRLRLGSHPDIGVGFAASETKLSQSAGKVLAPSPPTGLQAIQSPNEYYLGPHSVIAKLESTYGINRFVRLGVEISALHVTHYNFQIVECGNEQSNANTVS
jgi:hypothetical protein